MQSPPGTGAGETRKQDMPGNVVKVVHHWVFRASERPEAEPGVPSFVDLLDRILDKGLVLNATDRMLLGSGQRGTIRLDLQEDEIA